MQTYIHTRCSPETDRARCASPRRWGAARRGKTRTACSAARAPLSANLHVSAPRGPWTRHAWRRGWRHEGPAASSRPWRRASSGPGPHRRERQGQASLTSCHAARARATVQTRAQRTECAAQRSLENWLQPPLLSRVIQSQSVQLAVKKTSPSSMYHYAHTAVFRRHTVVPIPK